MMLGSILHEVKTFVNKHDDDLIDRYNHRYTVMILAVFIFLIASKQYFGEPIICWTPAQFTGSHNAYANTICWTHGTYPVGGDQPYHTVDRTKVLPYYQWVPFILLFQALCFMVPNVIWHTFSRAAGVDVTSLGKNAKAVDSLDVDRREKTIHQIARHIHISLSMKYEYIPMFKQINLKDRLPFGRRHGNYLYLTYLLVKVIYLLNISCQLILMNSFFGFQYHSYGFDFLRKFIIGEDYSRIDLAFPRITFCDFKIRNLGDNIHQHSVQCALPINLFNEKFFILLWFWLILLAVLTLLNLLSWLKLLAPSYRKKLITKYLKSHRKLGSGEKESDMFDAFVNEYFHLDGAFIIAIVRRNSNYLTTSEIVCALWSKFGRDYTRIHHEVPRSITGSSGGGGGGGGGGNLNPKSVEIGMAEFDDESDEKAPFNN